MNLTMHRALAILNPGSGARQAGEVTRQLLECAERMGVQLGVRYTAPGEPVPLLLNDALQFDRIIAAGGDGTLMDVFTGLKQVGYAGALAIVPAGTGNVLARALKIPTDIPSACALALDMNAATLLLDLGCAQMSNGRESCFALRLSAGYEAKVLETTTPELKSRFGKLAYVAQGALHAVTSSPAQYRCEVDGEIISRTAFAALVVNHGTLGVLGMNLDPAIDPHDGQLDLYLVGPDPSPGMINDILVGNAVPLDALAGRKPIRASILINAEPPQPVQADGDVIGITPVRVTILKDAVRLCVPAT
jgi:YegS/Rv2252/BmrU family lipid kinase